MKTKENRVGRQGGFPLEKVPDQVQATTLTIAVIALMASMYAIIVIWHVPEHLGLEKRIKGTETWIKSRCTNASISEACLNYSADPSLSRQK